MKSLDSGLTAIFAGTGFKSTYCVQARIAALSSKVTHHRIAQNFNPHDSRQKFQPLTDEFPPVFVISAGQRILPAEIRPPHASIDAMHDLNLARRQHIPPICACHLPAPNKT